MEGTLHTMHTMNYLQEVCWESWEAWRLGGLGHRSWEAWRLGGLGYRSWEAWRLGGFGYRSNHEHTNMQPGGGLRDGSVWSATTACHDVREVWHDRGMGKFRFLVG